LNDAYDAFRLLDSFPVRRESQPRKAMTGRFKTLDDIEIFMSFEVVSFISFLSPVASDVFRHYSQ